MAMTGGFSAQDITTIASAGFMGLAVLFLLILFATGRTPSSGSLWAAIAVIALAAIVQLSTTYMNTFVKARISVTLSPTPSGLASFLPSAAGAPLTSVPHLWLNTGDPKCNRFAAAYDPRSPACLAFAQAFTLDSPQEDIHVSVDDVMQELRDRVMRLAAVNAAISGPAEASISPGHPAIAENAAPL